MDNETKEQTYVLTGYLGPPACNPPARSVELRITPETGEYAFTFHGAENLSPLRVSASWNDLQLRFEYFLWLAKMFARIEEADQYRTGPFANHITMDLEIGPVALYVSLPTRHSPHAAHRKRVRCDFFILSSADTGEETYRRFVILVPIERAMDFGRSLSSGLEPLRASLSGGERLTVVE